MTRPHCSNPSHCSQYLGAAPRVVTVAAGISYVNGTPVEKPVNPRLRGSIKGGAALRRKVAGHKRGARDL